MNIIYPAIFHKEDGEYWCEFPDLPGCFSQDSTLIDAFNSASEALEGYVLTRLEEGKTLPQSSNLEDIKTDKNSFVNLISAHVSDTGRKIKKTLTIPFWLDKRAQKLNINFSKVLQDALLQEVLGTKT